MPTFVSTTPLFKSEVPHNQGPDNRGCTVLTKRPADLREIGLLYLTSLQKERDWTFILVISPILTCHTLAKRPADLREIGPLYLTLLRRELDWTFIMT